METKHTTASKLPTCVPWALDQAEAGDTVAVTRSGQPSAVIAPADALILPRFSGKPGRYLAADRPRGRQARRSRFIMDWDGSTWSIDGHLEDAPDEAFGPVATEEAGS